MIMMHLVAHYSTQNSESVVQFVAMLMTAPFQSLAPILKILVEWHQKSMRLYLILGQATDLNLTVKKHILWYSALIELGGEFRATKYN